MGRVQFFGLAVALAVAWFSPISAQETSPKDEKKASPFEDLKATEKPAERTGHVIKLAEPLPEGATLEDRLAAKGSFQGQESMLQAFFEELEKALGTPVMVSVKKLEEAAINPDTPITYKLKNVKVKTALRLILGEVGLTYVTRDDVIVITTPEDAGSQMVTRVYDCRDLMKLPSPVRKGRKEGAAAQRSQIGAAGLPEKVAEKKEEVGPGGGYEVADLIEAITTTVAPDSWEDVGGPGSLADFKGLLTVSQTQEVHEQVEQLLNMLHKAAGLEEKVKVSR